MDTNDLHNNVALARALSAVAIGTTGTGKTSAAIDRRGYGGIEFIINYGTITATGAVYTVLMTESDASTGGFTSVADGDMLGTEADAGLAAGTRTSGTTKNTQKKIGYKGNKRYAKLGVISTVTAGTLIAIDAILYNPAQAPTT